MKSGFNLYSDGKPLKKPIKILLITVALLLFLAWGYGQFVTRFFLVRFEKFYSANSEIVIYLAEDLDSDRIGRLELWQTVVVPKKGAELWVEVDKPVHGYIRREQLSTLDAMNKIRISKGLRPKSGAF